jgi:hypothetical protein
MVPTGLFERFLRIAVPSVTLKVPKNSLNPFGQKNGTPLPFKTLRSCRRLVASHSFILSFFQSNRFIFQDLLSFWVALHRSDETQNGT